MKLFDYKNFEITLAFRNPIYFVHQWKYWKLKYRIRGIGIWIFWYWKNNMCDVWIDYGIRIFGIEFNIRKF